MEIYEKLRKDEYIGDDPKAVRNYKAKAEALLIEVEQVSRQ
jgi:hypothetical protein